MGVADQNGGHRSAHPGIVRALRRLAADVPIRQVDSGHDAVGVDGQIETIAKRPGDIEALA